MVKYMKWTHGNGKLKHSVAKLYRGEDPGFCNWRGEARCMFGHVTCKVYAL